MFTGDTHPGACCCCSPYPPGEQTGRSERVEADSRATMEEEHAPAECEFDEYGFLCVGKGPSSDTEDGDFRCHDYQRGDEEKQAAEALEADWRAAIGSWRTMGRGRIEALVQKGVPNCLRGEVWSLMLDCDAMRKSAGIDYQRELAAAEDVVAAREKAEEDHDAAGREWAALYGSKERGDRSEPPAELKADTQLPTAKAVRQIGLDLHRTFYTHRMFRERGGEGQQALYRVLSVYARYNPSVGYCQGMSYIAAVLLMHMSEEDAFWALMALLENKKYLHDFYSKSLSRVQSEALAFQGLVARRMPDLAQHMSELAVHPLM